MIRFRTLGTLDLTGPDGRSLYAVLAQPKRLALLTWLALARPRGFHRRDTVLGLFWPELDDVHARAALNQAVYHLRRSLGRDVVRSRGQEELGIDTALLWCDVVAFDEALDARDPRRAVDLYTGDLLTGFFLTGAPEWERWLDEERARLRARAAEAAFRVARQTAAGRKAEDTAAWARRGLLLAPGDEPRLRAAVTLLADLGDRAGAIRLYEDFAAQWLRDAEITPSAETVAFIDGIRAHEAAHAAPPVNAVWPMDAVGGDGAASQPSRTAPHRRRALYAALTAALLLTAGVLAFDHSRAPRRGGDIPLESGMPVAEAYAEYLRGRHFLARLDLPAFEAARNHFERATDLDPSFARAWSGLAEAYLHIYSMQTVAADDAYPRARTAAERALALDPDLAEAHAALAMTLTMYYWDTPAAERHFRRAIELDPDAPRARRMYASHLRNLGRFDEALVHIRHAQQLDPLFAFAHIEEAITLLTSRDYDAALRKLQRYVRLTPGDTHAYVFLGMVHMAENRHAEALAALDVTDPQRQRPDAQALRGVVYGRMGRTDDARAILRELDEMQRAQRPVTDFHRATVYIAMGDHERALDLLESAVRSRGFQMRLLKVMPTFDPLRSEPRFQALLKRVGLE
jgi:DNA-binding SARP family transcriptional activator